MDSLRFSAETGDFEALIIHGGDRYRMLIVDLAEAELAQARTLAQALGSWLPTHLPSVGHFCAEKLLALKNEHWLAEGEKPLTAAAFAANLQMESVIVYADGTFSVYCNDGNLFWGHVIVVDVDQDFMLLDAYLSGQLT